MARKGIAESEIIASANALINKGIVPTAAGIRKHLGRGSLTTIQKYFRSWKLGSFKDHGETKEEQRESSQAFIQKDRVDTQLLQKRILELEQQCQVLSQELIKKEQDNLKLNKDNIKLAQNLEQLTEAHKMLLLKFENIDSRYEDLKKERENAIQRVLEDKNKQVESLKYEIKEMNELHLNAITDLGQRNDELLIEEKVKTINLTEKVKELQHSIKMVEEKLGKSEGINIPLQKEVKRQKAIIDKFVTGEQLKEFSHQTDGAVND